MIDLNNMDFNPRDARDREIKRTSEGGVRISRPVEHREEEMETDGRGGNMADYGHRARRSSKGPWILLAAVIIVIGVVGFIFRDKLFSTQAPSGKLQAVFLTNGQVYFGKLTETGGRYATLQNIYYLQVTPVLQTKTEGQPGSQATSQQQQQQQLSLVKLGNEMHGPVDKMSINRDQILFIEDLKDDGRVVQAIKEYEAGQQKK